MKRNHPIDKIVRIYDDESCGLFGDRYTVVYSPIEGRNGLYWPFLSSNTCGTFYHGELNERPGKFLGKRVGFSGLPDSVRSTILADLRGMAD